MEPGAKSLSCEVGSIKVETCEPLKETGSLIREKLLPVRSVLRPAHGEITSKEKPTTAENVE